MISRRLASGPAAAVFALAVLAGTVTDKTTGQPLPNVRVAVGSVHALTRADGSYRLPALKPGPATVTVSSDDVPPQTFTITVHARGAHADFHACSTTLDYHCGGL